MIQWLMILFMMKIKSHILMKSVSVLLFGWCNPARVSGMKRCNFITRETGQNLINTQSPGLAGGGWVMP